jgi:DNA-binding Xre family transcriptional regulator
MISYAPLIATLKQKGITVTDVVRECRLHPRTTTKIRDNESMNLTTVAKICLFLDVPIENVVRITLE